MKKLFPGILFLLMISTLSFAQGPRGGERPSPEDMAKRTTEWMIKELDLTPEQVNPIDSINLLFAKAQELIFQSIGEERDREEIRETLNALEQERIKSYSEFLSADQLELYKKKTEERMKERRNRRR